MPTFDLRDVLEGILDDASRCRLVVSFVHVTTNLFGKYPVVCRNTAKAQAAGDKSSERALFGALVSDLKYSSEEQIASSVQITVKTHKDAGKVKARNIHASRASLFRPIRRFITNTLHLQLDSLPYLVKDPIALVRLIESSRISCDARLIKCDADEFYMSGEHDVLANDWAEHIHLEAIQFLLNTQDVSDGTKCGKVLRGSSMDEEHSDAISDCCFCLHRM